MLHWVPSWRMAWLVAAGLICLGYVLQRRRPGATLLPAFAQESGILLALYGLWQLAGSLARSRPPTGALSRGESIWHLERLLHLPSETSVQRLVLPHPRLVEFFNGYYSFAHFNGLLLTLLWIFLRRRDRYPEARNVVAATTFFCLLVSLIPVAPPRLLGGHGIVDAAAIYGQSVYGPVGTGISDQYSAMPSVHIAWATAVAVLLLRSGRGWWRWIGVAHAGLTLVVVVATANHYWADAAVAMGLLALALAAVRLLPRLRRMGDVLVRAARPAQPAAVAMAEPPTS